MLGNKTQITPSSEVSIPSVAKTGFKGEESRRKKMIQVRARVKQFENQFPGQYNPTLIQDLQYLGDPRPDYIPHVDWERTVKEITPIYSLMLYMSAWGMEDADIAKSVGRNKLATKQFLQTLQAKEEIRKIQEKIWGQDPKQWVSQILPVAMKVALDIMTDPKVKAQTRLDAANRFLDRHMGKPTQKIEVEESMVRKLYELLDQKAQNTIIEVSSTEKIEEGQIVNENYQNVDQDSIDETPADKDRVDQWVEDSLGKI